LIKREILNHYYMVLAQVRTLILIQKLTLIGIEASIKNSKLKTIKKYLKLKILSEDLK